MIAEISISLGRKLKWDPTTERFVGDNQANQLLSAPMRSPWHL
jgi:myo-inositol 2-dehydrogenase / D-chiro-inositol 1-dehydrogenase